MHGTQGVQAVMDLDSLQNVLDKAYQAILRAKALSERLSAEGSMPAATSTAVVNNTMGVQATSHREALTLESEEANHSAVPGGAFMADSANEQAQVQAGEQFQHVASSEVVARHTTDDVQDNGSLLSDSSTESAGQEVDVILAPVSNVEQHMHNNTASSSLDSDVSHGHNSAANAAVPDIDSTSDTDVSPPGEPDADAGNQASNDSAAQSNGPALPTPAHPGNAADQALEGRESPSASTVTTLVAQEDIAAPTGGANSRTDAQSNGLTPAPPLAAQSESSGRPGQGEDLMRQVHTATQMNLQAQVAAGPAAAVAEAAAAAAIAAAAEAATGAVMQEEAQLSREFGSPLASVARRLSELQQQQNNTINQLLELRQEQLRLRKQQLSALQELLRTETAMAEATPRQVRATSQALSLLEQCLSDVDVAAASIAAASTPTASGMPAFSFIGNNLNVAMLAATVSSADARAESISRMSRQLLTVIREFSATRNRTRRPAPATAAPARPAQTVPPPSVPAPSVPTPAPPAQPLPVSSMSFPSFGPPSVPPPTSTLASPAHPPSALAPTSSSPFIPQPRPAPSAAPLVRPGAPVPASSIINGVAVVGNSTGGTIDTDTEPSDAPAGPSMPARTRERVRGALAMELALMPVSICNPGHPLIQRGDACAICLNDFAPNDRFKCMPCTHAFHGHCLDLWLLRTANCPLCKTALPGTTFTSSNEHPLNTTNPARPAQVSAPVVTSDAADAAPTAAPVFSFRAADAAANPAPRFTFGAAGLNARIGPAFSFGTANAGARAERISARAERICARAEQISARARSVTSQGAAGAAAWAEQISSLGLEHTAADAAPSFTFGADPAAADSAEEQLESLFQAAFNEGFNPGQRSDSVLQRLEDHAASMPAGAGRTQRVLADVLARLRRSQEPHSRPNT